MQKFTVYRRGPHRRKLLEVSLGDNHLSISGLSHMISSLEKHGVTDVLSGKRFSVKTDSKDKNAPVVFEVLKSRFSRDSAYEIHDHSP